LKSGLNPNTAVLGLDIPDLLAPVREDVAPVREDCVQSSVEFHTNSPPNSSISNLSPSTTLSPNTSRNTSSPSQSTLSDPSSTDQTTTRNTSSSLGPLSPSPVDIVTLRSPDRHTPNTASGAFLGGLRHHCGSCNQIFEKLYLLNKHRRTQHLRPYKCLVSGCPYHTTGFGKRNDLERHKTSTHPDLFQALSYTCPYVGCPHFALGFPRKDNCKRHIERQHSNFPYLPPIATDTSIGPED